MTQVREWRI